MALLHNLGLILHNFVGGVLGSTSMTAMYKRPARWDLLSFCAPTIFGSINMGVGLSVCNAW